MLSNVRRWRMYAKSLLLNRSGLSHHAQGFFQMFVQKAGGGGMRLYGLLGEGGGGGGQVHVHICVQNVWQTRGVRRHAPLGNFDFGTSIRHNLVESGTVFEQT